MLKLFFKPKPKPGQEEVASPLDQSLFAPARGASNPPETKGGPEVTNEWGAPLADFDLDAEFMELTAATSPDASMLMPVSEEPGLVGAEEELLSEPAPTLSPPQSMSSLGRVEVISTEFALGWAAVTESGSFSCVYAKLGNDVLGYALADHTRKDLAAARTAGTLNARAFAILFTRPVPAHRVTDIEVFLIGKPWPVPKDTNLRVNAEVPLQIFLLGSPRSGTSQLGKTLVEALGLAWTGEAHIMPSFQKAADALTGETQNGGYFLHFLNEQSYRSIAINAARQAYYHVHSSTSFVDKTPGVAMVGAASFAAEVFPAARFVYLMRHPITNIMSRLTRFGGVFEEHCADWAATVQAWESTRSALPSSVVVKQEDMLLEPGGIARRIATYIGRPEATLAIEKSLIAGSTEKTGAGLVSMELKDTDWTQQQKIAFVDICGAAARTHGYLL